MPITAHLEELRWRLLKSLIAVAIAFAPCYVFSDQLFKFLTRPLLGLGIKEIDLIGTGLPEAFFTRLKVSFIAGIFLASPVIFYQAWRFVEPGLLETEKHYARPFVAAATFFFLCGAAFCYLVVFPVGYAFFVREYQSIGVTPAIRISEYLSFTARMLLAFGATFELPVAAFFLSRAGLIDHTFLLRYLRHAILVVFIVAAILTPPDVASQVLMAIPLLLLYLLSIGVAYAARREPAEKTEGSALPAPRGRA